jgi:hypothetical protein
MVKKHQPSNGTSADSLRGEFSQLPGILLSSGRKRLEFESGECWEMHSDQRY